jgi:hypothetical protein
MYGHAGAARRTVGRRRIRLRFVIGTFVPLHVLVGQVAIAGNTIAGKVVLIRIGRITFVSHALSSVFYKAILLGSSRFRPASQLVVNGESGGPGLPRCVHHPGRNFMVTSLRSATPPRHKLLGSAFLQQRNCAVGAPFPFAGICEACSS